jgi:tellurite resistance protein
MDAVLMACLAVACAQGWRITRDKGHHALALEGAAQTLAQWFAEHHATLMARGLQL